MRYKVQLTVCERPEKVLLTWKHLNEQEVVAKVTWAYIHYNVKSITITREGNEQA